ncbi:PilZ domain-containing protein [Novilysobacter spongiicola]|uniref:PilZ domain-containing protein n=1 Tax=Lysobacter spongiicola DSM 21749 TaxID=1122188 RepID=A0A1T4RP54_9GAMM|nr:PilZ domain-containing protein [Lysobacter spongiicola]MDX1549367.1 PilZ domain-containing protein [Lysobacter spongiicola]SKA17732.1 PilZ domain-containing protein [Lysobacter spongiicola DSM 21749]
MKYDEYRHARRYDVPDTVKVVDTMTDEVVGQLGNVSETGMLLMANRPLVDDALYQFRLEVGDGFDHEQPIEVGAHLLWQESAGASGQWWAGFRFIKVLDGHAQPLRHWLDTLVPAAQ